MSSRRPVAEFQATRCPRCGSIRHEHVKRHESPGGTVSQTRRCRSCLVLFDVRLPEVLVEARRETAAPIVSEVSDTGKKQGLSDTGKRGRSRGHEQRGRSQGKARAGR